MAKVHLDCPKEHSPIVSKDFKYLKMATEERLTLMQHRNPKSPKMNSTFDEQGFCDCIQLVTEKQNTGVHESNLYLPRLGALSNEKPRRSDERPWKVVTEDGTSATRQTLESWFETKRSPIFIFRKSTLGQFVDRNSQTKELCQSPTGKFSKTVSIETSRRRNPRSTSFSFA